MDIQEIKDRYSEYNFHFHKDHYEKEAPLIHAINILLVEIDNLTTERNNLQSRSMNAESKTMEIEYNIGYLIDKYKKIQQQDKPFKAFRNMPERLLVDIIKDLNELLRSATE